MRVRPHIPNSPSGSSLQKLLKDPFGVIDCDGKPQLFRTALQLQGIDPNQATWNEQWMSWPVDKHYEEQSNYTLAERLQGKLFLAHGDVDENVPIPATIKLVGALVKANKDFDFLIMPNRPHGFGNDPYFGRRRWDYFVKNLLGVDPPAGFNISQPRTTSTSQADHLK